MTIFSYGYCPADSDRVRREAEFELLRTNLDFILEHRGKILRDKECFFCSLSFAWASVPYIGGGGPLCLGHLLLGWENEIMKEPCTECGGEILVTSFGGSVLSGSTGWSGICSSCNIREHRRGSVHKPFARRAHFVCSLLKRFPEEKIGVEDFDGFEFSWGGNGLKPARKKRQLTTRVVAEIALAEVLVRIRN